MDFTSIILGVLLTAVIYLAFPLIKLLINDGKFPKERAHKIALWNSIILGLISCVVASAKYATWSAGPAFLYYWINCAILTRKDANEAVHVNDKASSNSYSQGDPCVKQHSYYNKEQAVHTDEVRFCRKCGERLIDDGAFCHKCGTKKEKQANAVDKMQFCPKCGQKIAENGIFCHKCGTKILSISEEKATCEVEKNISCVGEEQEFFDAEQLDNSVQSGETEENIFFEEHICSSEQELKEYIEQILEEKSKPQILLDLYWKYKKYNYGFYPKKETKVALQDVINNCTENDCEGNSELMISVSKAKLSKL